MIDNFFEFSLNGVLYKGKSVGGDPPLRESGQALRAQNAQLVQGETGAVFNMRPDVLVWSWTDWSGGEGQNTYDPQEPGRYKSGRSINPVAVPGTLRAGPAVQITKASDGTTPFTMDTTASLKVGSLVFYRDALLFFDKANKYVWDTVNEKWGAGSAVTGTGSAIRDADSDYEYVWLSDSTEIQRWNNTVWETFATDSYITMSEMIELGGSIFHVGQANTVGKRWVTVLEYDKTDAAPATATIVYEGVGYPHSLDEPDGTLHKQLSCQGANRVYVATVYGMQTTVHEIIPTTAAAAGSGAAIAMLPAQALSMVWSGGLIFLHCNILGQDSTEQMGHGVLMYVNPTDGTYGVVDRVRPFSFSKGSIYSLSAQREVAGLSENYIGMMLAESSGGTFVTEVVLFDTVNGALHPYARCAGGHSGAGPSSMIRFRGEIFIAEARDDEGYIFRLLKDAYEGDDVTPEVVSASWDFGLVDEKVLSSLRVVSETVPANWTISIDYDLDDSGSWTNAGTIAAGAEGGTLTISTDSTTKKFRSMRMRAQFVWGGSGQPATTPVLLGIEARAQVTQKLRSWTAILDCSDDQGQAQGQSLKGHQKIDNIQTAGAPNGNVVSFKNGFAHRQPNQYDEYDVIVDDYEIFMLRPGEGYAVVRLIEVA